MIMEILSRILRPVFLWRHGITNLESGKGRRIFWWSAKDLYRLYCGGKTLTGRWEEAGLKVRGSCAADYLDKSSTHWNAISPEHLAAEFICAARRQSLPNAVTHQMSKKRTNPAGSLFSWNLRHYNEKHYRLFDKMRIVNLMVLCWKMRRRMR